MDSALLPDMLGYADLADAGFTRRQFERLLEIGEYERSGCTQQNALEILL